MATATAAATHEAPPLEEGSAPAGPSAPPWDRTLSLEARLCMVKLALGAKIEKGGTADPAMGGWAFVEYDDVAELIGTALATHGVCWTQGMPELELELLAAKTSTGKDNYRAIVTIEFTFTSADDREQSITRSWKGQADDTGDKSIQQAATSCTKYFLLKAFLLAGQDSTDPDSKVNEGGSSGGSNSRSAKPGICEQCKALGGKSKKGYPAKFWPNENVSSGFQCDGMVDGRYMNHQPTPPPGSAATPSAGVGTAPATQSTAESDALKLTIEALRGLPTGWPQRMAEKLAVDVDQRFAKGITPSVLREMPEDKLKFIRDWAELLAEQAAKGVDPWPATDPGDIDPDDIPFN